MLTGMMMVISGLAYYAGRRRAEEYRFTGRYRGCTSPQISIRFQCDLKSSPTAGLLWGPTIRWFYVSGNDGTVLRTLTDSTAIVNAVMEDHNGDLLVGTANGKLYRYDTDSWAVETLSLAHGASIVSLEEYDNSTYHVGTQNGKLTQVGVIGL